MTSIPNLEMAARQAQRSHEIEPEHGLFRAIMDQSPVGIAVLDGQELRALCANPTYLELLEEPYRSRGITGRLLVEFVPHSAESGLTEILHQVVTTHQAHPGLEHVHVDAARGITYWRWAFLPLTTAGSDTTHLMIVATEITEAVTAPRSLNLGSVLETWLGYLAKLVPYDSGAIILIGDDSRLHLRAMRGYEKSSRPELISQSTIQAQAGPLIQKLLATRESVLIENTHQHPDWNVQGETAYVHSWLGVPLIAGANVIGLFALDNSEIGFFTQEHRRLAEALGAQAAVSIQSASLFEQVLSARQHLQFLSRRLIEVQENERRYIARELHDEAGQALTNIIVGLRLLERKANDPKRVLAQTKELRSTVDEVLENLHRLSMDLMPASLDHLGLKGALLQYIESFGEQHQLQVSFKTEGFESMRLAPDLETTLYRFVQEALTNIARHAKATQVQVSLERSATAIRTTVQDNGIGFNPEVVVPSGHLGLLGIRERAEILGGTLSVTSNPGQGTTLIMEFPYGDSYPDC